MAILRDLPCPVCAHNVSFDVAWLATRFQDGTERWGRAHVCNSCGVLRFYDSAKPSDFQGDLGAESVDPASPPV